MFRQLLTDEAEEIANQIIDILDDAGYSPGEIIPGCIQAVVRLARGDDALLDEAANLLADGGV